MREHVFGSPPSCPNCTSSEFKEVEISKEGGIKKHQEEVPLHGKDEARLS